MSKEKKDKEQFPEHIHVRLWQGDLVIINPSYVDQVRDTTSVVQYTRTDVSESEAKEWGKQMRELMIKHNESSSERSD